MTTEISADPEDLPAIEADGGIVQLAGGEAIPSFCAWAANAWAASSPAKPWGQSDPADARWARLCG
jgi:hypothetical protein